MWQLPETVIRTIGVEEGMVVADVGAGYGYFTLRLARAVGREGHVYANDIDHDALAQLENRCANDGVNNVTTILGESSDPLLPPGVDLVLMVNTIHLLEDPVAFLQRISDSLQPQARLVIVQWDAEKMSAELGDLSPGDKILFARETFLATVGDAGFTLDRIETFLPVQSIFIYRRNS
jgi:ubiquinone/menaquinone biosynthesis C-methylase UbiE